MGTQRSPAEVSPKPGDTDSAVGGPQLDRSGEQHGGRGTRAGLRSHPQRGEDRDGMRDRGARMLPAPLLSHKATSPVD